MSVSRQEKFLTSGRQNQKMRTREALLEAAIALAKDGRSPSIPEVAEAARVSPATAYRYFPNPQSLWNEISSREESLRRDFVGVLEGLTGDAEERIDTVVRSAATMQFADQLLWRTVLRSIQDRWIEQADLPEADRVPNRGTTRLQMARTALEPLADRLPPEQLDRLVNAVSLVYGIEALVSTQDILGLSPEAATDLMSWSARALIRAALAEAEAPQAD
ncbi:TetR/AcrR family transcriptional regulator [Nocardia concava]|uniref:TetR/AcrR family transcriptional regulator n=1 Tax=Nocardia concava TaxID=257281 RepID=UPI0007C5BB50|nr:TetR family transcriptional regulator [Nocardia concava]